MSYTKRADEDYLNLPIVVGVGRVTDKRIRDKVYREKVTGEGRSPLDLMERACIKAIEDVGINASSVVDTIDALSVVKTDIDSRTGKKPLYTNIPLALSRRLNVQKNKPYLAYSNPGGQSPQYLVNHFSEKINNGEIKMAVVSGVEALATFAVLKAQKKPIPWGNAAKERGTEPGDEPPSEVLGDATMGATITEVLNGMIAPKVAYSLLEQTLRAKLGKTQEEHAVITSKLFEKYNKVASEKENEEHSWFPERYTAEEIRTPSESNRWVSYPYTKRMCAIMDVDQSAAVVVTSVREAERLGIPKEKWVFLRGCGDCIEPAVFITSRPEMYRSLALKAASEAAFRMAGIKSINDVSLLSIYSCFPIAVEAACYELGIDPLNDKRDFTQIGGLPYHGGPGNNYVLHEIVGMCESLRKNKAGPTGYGYVNGNGWFITKQSVGIYSLAPPSPGQKWKREPYLEIQEKLSATATVLELAEQPNGLGKIETYCVSHEKGYRQSIVIGRMITSNDKGKRFIASTKDENIANYLMSNECLGKTVSVKTTTVKSKVGDVEVGVFTIQGDEQRASL